MHENKKDSHLSKLKKIFKKMPELFESLVNEEDIVVHQNLTYVLISDD